MRDSALELGRLTAGAQDVLPAGSLAEQITGGRPLRVKLGIDPTAPDIHLGHVVVLTKLAQFQEAGHQVVLIIGDYTARVGDPSGRDSQRPVLRPEQIDAHGRTFQDQAFKVLDREQTEVRFNSEWLDMPTDRLFALLSRTTVARLLEREDFSSRMAEGKPISAIELLYPVMQGYDSVAVEADVELGGTDQTFNLLMGRDIQQAYGMKPQSIMTLPILPGLDGKRRMSKSLGNYVGVTDAPEEMFGKLMSLPDEVMPTYYLLLLGVELDTSRHPNEAKRELARRLTDRFHGAGAGTAGEGHFDRVHRDKGVPERIEDVDLSGIEGWTKDGDQALEVHLPALLAREFGLSTGEARRLIGQGGVRLDGEPLDPASLDVPLSELSGKVLQVGKRRFRRVPGTAK